jgi:HlyD family secretion protein
MIKEWLVQLDRKWILGAAGVVIIAAAGVVYWLLRPAPAIGILEANGRTEGTEVTLSAKVGGRALDVAVREGQQVEAGALIAKIDARELEAQLAQAQAAAAAAKAQIDAMDAQARAAGRSVEQARIGEGVVQATTAHESHRATESVARAAAEVQVAEARWREQRDSYERYQKLGKDGFVSASFLDQARSRLEAAEAGLRAAKQAQEEAAAGLQKAQAAGGEVALRRMEVERLAAEEERARAGRAVAEEQAKAAAARVTELQALLTDTEIRAPTRGTVINRLVEPGELVAAGRPIITLIDLASLYVRVYIPEREIGKIKIGDLARLTADAFPGRAFSGKVVEISQSAEFTPKDVHTKDEREKLMFGVKVAIDSPGGEIKPGMPLDARIRWKPDAAW